MLHGAPWQNLIPKAAYLTDRRFSGRKCSTMRVSTPSATPLVSEHAWSTYMHKVKVTENLHGTPACIQKVAPGLLRLNPRTKCRAIHFRGIPLPRVIGSFFRFCCPSLRACVPIRNPESSDTVFKAKNGGGAVSRTLETEVDLDFDATIQFRIPESHRH